MWMCMRTIIFGCVLSIGCVNDNYSHMRLMSAYSGASLHTLTDTLCSRVSTLWNQNGGMTSISPGPTSATLAPALSMRVRVCVCVSGESVCVCVCV